GGQGEGRRRGGTGVDQRCHAAGGDRGFTGHVASAAGNAAGHTVLVDRTGLLRLARLRRVVVDGDDQGVGRCGHRVLVEVGGEQDRAEVDGEIVLGVVTSQAVEARVVGLGEPGERPGAPCDVQRAGGDGGG